MRISSSRARLSILAGLVATLIVPAYSAYRGHADDQDVRAVLDAYPALKGTPADSCATCHTTGKVKDQAAASGTRDENHCDYCHAVFVREHRDARETLNLYGAAYLAAGRGRDAVRALASKDSDGDGARNGLELEQGTNPGDPASRPSAPLAPSRALSAAALSSLVPAIDQPLFLNSTKSRSGDSYGTYRGVALWDVLEAIGAGQAESVDVLAADGYERTFTLDELKKAWPQGRPVMGLGSDALGPCGWVHYDAPGLAAAAPLPGARVMLALEENGKPLERATVDPASGRIVGKGRMRLVAPQFTISPPDLPQTADPSCAARVAPEFRFHDDYDHNAGASVAAVVAVRVKPLPAGTRDIDWQTPAPRLLRDEQIVFFGAVKAARSGSR